MKKVFAIVVLAATLFAVNTSFPAISFPAVISADEVSVSQEAIINSQWAALYNYVCSLTEDGSLPDFWAGGAMLDDRSGIEIFVTCAPDEIIDDIIRVTGNDNFKVTQVEYSENFLRSIVDYISDRKFELYEESDDNPALKELHINIPIIGLSVVSNCVVVYFSSDSNYDEAVSLFKNYIMDAPYVKFEQMEKEIFGEETESDEPKSKGCNQIAEICLSHSFPYQNIGEYIGKNDCSPEETEIITSFLTSKIYDEYDKLIQLCDAIGTAIGVSLIEIRVMDVIRRHGFTNLTLNKIEAIFALKKHFDKLCNKNIYDLFRAVQMEKSSNRANGKRKKCMVSDQRRSDTPPGLFLKRLRPRALVFCRIRCCAGGDANTRHADFVRYYRGFEGARVPPSFKRGPWIAIFSFIKFHLHSSKKFRNP